MKTNEELVMSIQEKYKITNSFTCDEYNLLAERIHPYVTNALRKKVFNRNDLEDTVQEFFLNRFQRAVVKFDTNNPANLKFTSFVFHSAMQHVTDYVRRNASSASKSVQEQNFESILSSWDDKYPLDIIDLSKFLVDFINRVVTYSKYIVSYYSYNEFFAESADLPVTDILDVKWLISKSDEGYSKLCKYIDASVLVFNKILWREDYKSVRGSFMDSLSSRLQNRTIKGESSIKEDCAKTSKSPTENQIKQWSRDASRQLKNSWNQFVFEYFGKGE